MTAQNDPLSQLTGHNRPANEPIPAPTTPPPAQRSIWIIRIWDRGEKHGMFNLATEVPEVEGMAMIAAGRAEQVPDPRTSPPDESTGENDPTPIHAPTSPAPTAPEGPFPFVVAEETPVSPRLGERLNAIPPRIMQMSRTPTIGEVRRKAAEECRIRAMRAAIPPDPGPLATRNKPLRQSINAARVKLHRLRLRLSMTEAGTRAMLGTGQTACNRWYQLENPYLRKDGKPRKISPRIAKQMAKALQCRPEELCGPMGNLADVPPNTDLSDYDKGYAAGHEAAYAEAYADAYAAAMQEIEKARQGEQLEAQ